MIASAETAFVFSMPERDHPLSGKVAFMRVLSRINVVTRNTEYERSYMHTIVIVIKKTHRWKDNMVCANM